MALPGIEQELSSPWRGHSLSARGEVARALVLLPVANTTFRSTCVDRLGAVVCGANVGAGTGEATRPRAERVADPSMLSRTGVVVAAAYLSRQALKLRKARRLLDDLATRAQESEELEHEFRRVLARERGLQLELACESQDSPARNMMQRLMWNGADAEDDSTGTQVWDARVRSLIDAVDATGGKTPSVYTRSQVGMPETPEPNGASRRGAAGTRTSPTRYTTAEVDALFYQVNASDSESLHRIWKKEDQSPRAKEVGKGDDTSAMDYYIAAEPHRIATGLADAVAADDEAADRIVECRTRNGERVGLKALRHLARRVSASPSQRPIEKVRSYQTEVARATANLFAASSTPHLAAFEAADAGLVAVLSEWAMADDGAPGSHLQAEACRALHNMSSGVLSGSQPRFVLENGFLPLQKADRTLLRASSPADPPSSNDLDIVLVHGLRGGPLITWRSEPGDLDRQARAQDAKPRAERTATGLQPMTVWPRDWLPADVLGSRVFSFGHDAGVLRGGLGPGMIGPSLEERAVDVRSALRKGGVGQGGRRIVFITHSYGGLLVKEALLQDRSLLASTRAVVFLGVPHFGSPAAATLSRSHLALSSAVRELYPEVSGPLARLNDGFLEAVSHRVGAPNESAIQVLSFAEGKPVRLGATRGRSSVSVELVPSESANPGVGEFIVVQDADHVEICKPRSRADVVYQTIVGLLRAV